MLKFSTPSQKCIVGVPLCPGMGATNVIFEAFIDFRSMTIGMYHQRSSDRCHAGSHIGSWL